MIVAGLGFRPICDADEIAQLLGDAAKRCGRPPSLLAVPWFRSRAPVLRVLRAAGPEIVVITEAALRAVQPSCSTRSARALATHGIASVAEGCALAGAGTGAVLVLARIASTSATCAIAEGMER